MPKKSMDKGSMLSGVSEETFSPLERNTSLAQRVTEMIRHSIVSGVLPPGEVISPQEIGNRLGVSRTPVREALIHLNAVGLVEFLPTRVRIASPTQSAILDAFELREALEGMAASLAAKRRTQEIAERILELARQTEEAQYDRKRFQEVDRNFHRAIAEAANSASLNQYLSYALDLALTLRNLKVAKGHFRPTAVGDHVKIADAILEKDSEGAERLIREHIRKVRDHVARRAV